MQWVECVTRANKSFEKMDDGKVFRIRYEEFVSNQCEITKEIANFVGFHFRNDTKLPTIWKTSVGKGYINLSPNQLGIIIPIIEQTMVNNKYSCQQNAL